MARHDQRPDKSMMICPNCKAGKCNECVDILRLVYSKKRICECTKKGHSGEPRDQQIRDPFDGKIYAPGLTVGEGGEVTMSTTPCFFCGEGVVPYTPGVAKQVTGFVGGPKMDSMSLREDTGKHAHQTCVDKVKEGQVPGEPDLFSADPTDS
jgi:hypothetical protein